MNPNYYFIHEIMKLSIVTKKKIKIYSSYNKEYYFQNIVQNILKLTYTSTFSFEIKLDIACTYVHHITKKKINPKIFSHKKYFNREKVYVSLKLTLI